MFIKNLFYLCLILANIALATEKPNLFLLKTYDAKKSVVGWVMSEKLDGVRGFWNGKKLLTRSGNEIIAPNWFIKNYPPFAIDGELWTKRGDFEEISSIVRRKKADKRWNKITHQIFEVPNQKGGLLERLKILKNYLNNYPNSPIKIVQQRPITKQNQVKRFLNAVVKKNGEGLVIRNPNTPYKTGRLSSALKVKKYLDIECVVTKIMLGKGKYNNKMGSLLCQTDNGIIVKIGSGFNDLERENPPNIGAIITFKYYGFTKNAKFKFPIFLRIRKQN